MYDTTNSVKSPQVMYTGLGNLQLSKTYSLPKNTMLWTRCVLKDVVLMAYFVGKPGVVLVAFHSKNYEMEGLLCQLEAIHNFLREWQQFSNISLITSSGIISGILSKTRPCPTLLKSLVRDVFVALDGRKLDICLDTNNEAVAMALDAKSQTSTTLELLSNAYFDHSLKG